MVHIYYSGGESDTLQPEHVIENSHRMLTYYKMYPVGLDGKKRPSARFKRILEYRKKRKK